MRRVTRVEARAGNGAIELLLECGHRTRRRVHLCLPQRVLCAECAGAR